MIKIQDVVKDILYSDEEALFALSKGYMNLSAYAQQIKARVEYGSKKDVKTTGIVVALSRIKKQLNQAHPLIQDVKINNLTIKSPLTEISFEKKEAIVSKLSSLYKKVKTTNDDFLTMTLSTSEISIICSDRIKQKIIDHVAEKPKMVQEKLASIGIAFDPQYYTMPNVTYSLLRRIAQKRIVIAETITTHTEIIFIFHQKDLAEIMRLFSAA